MTITRVPGDDYDNGQSSSRKRRLKLTERHSPVEGYIEDDDAPDPKRSKPDDQISSPAYLSSSQSVRISRFREAVYDRSTEIMPITVQHTSGQPFSFDSISTGQPDFVGGHPKEARRKLDSQQHHGQVQSNAPEFSSATTEDTRGSGIFRFGKSLASSVNPVNIWQKIASNWKEAREEVLKDQMEARRLLAIERERQRNSNRKHVDLRRSEIWNIQSGDMAAPKTACAASVDESHAFPPSGDVKKKKVDSKLTDQPIALEAKKLRARKSSFNLKSPSMLSLKKVKSEHHLRSKVSLAPHAPVDTPGSVPTLRKVTSKRDLHRQRILTKRVSDLESRLIEARRQLQASITDAPPVPEIPASHDYNEELTAAVIGDFPRTLDQQPPARKTFVPGALPSLPSERLLCVEQLESTSSVTDQPSLTIGGLQVTSGSSLSLDNTISRPAVSAAKKRKSLDDENEAQSHYDSGLMNNGNGDRSPENRPRSPKKKRNSVNLHNSFTLHAGSLQHDSVPGGKEVASHVVNASMTIGAPATSEYPLVTVPEECQSGITFTNDTEPSPSKPAKVGLGQRYRKSMVNGVGSPVSSSRSSLLPRRKTTILLKENVSGEAEDVQTGNATAKEAWEWPADVF